MIQVTGRENNHTQFLRLIRVRLDQIEMNGNYRSTIKPGARVLIVLKEHQRTGTLTEGIVKDLLTKSSSHPHGIKVRLESGEVGRVKQILE